MAVLSAVQEAIVSTAGTTLLGLYLWGSSVAGGYDPGVSDLDLVAVLEEPVTDELAAALRGMHTALARRWPRWDGRIEVVYVPRQGLARLPAGGIAGMAVISPGEAFHVLHGGPDWVLTWYPARQEAVALLGPAITTVIREIAAWEYLDSVRAYVGGFRHSIGDDATPGSQAYAVLSACRGLYTISLGQRPSKRHAAEWAAREFPEWGTLIANAMAWRAVQWTDANINGAATVPETRRFLQAMVARIADPAAPPAGTA